MSDAPKWLNAPTGDGWWWRLHGALPPHVVEVFRGVMRKIDDGGDWTTIPPSDKWMPIAQPFPPPAPLPKSKQVTLTATVHRPGKWRAEIYCDIAGQRNVNGLVCDTRDEAIKWVRDNYGIEPDVPT